MNDRDFWYVLADSREFTQKRIIKRTILGEWLVGFRTNDGEVVVLQDRCLHRQARLSAGRLEHGGLRCPYHGWRYDRTGAVVHIPSEGPGKPKGPCRQAKKYRTLEQDDLVFVCLADEPALAGPYRSPCYQEPGWATRRLINRIANDVTSCVENFVDVPHTAYVHPRIFRSPKGEAVQATVSRQNGAVKVTYRNEQKNFGWFRRFLNPSGAPIQHTDAFHMPNFTTVSYEFGSDRFLHITSQSVPVGERETLVYTDMTYRFGLWTRFAGPWVRTLAQRVIDQDIAHPFAAQRRGGRGRGRGDQDGRPAEH